MVNYNKNTVGLVNQNDVDTNENKELKFNNEHMGNFLKKSSYSAFKGGSRDSKHEPNDQDMRCMKFSKYSTKKYKIGADTQ